MSALALGSDVDGGVCACDPVGSSSARAAIKARFK